jgi:phage major head subunit gpT-like protein
MKITSKIMLIAVAALASVAAVAGAMPADHVAGLAALTATPHDLSGLSLFGFGGLVVNKGNLAILNQAFNAAFKNGVGMAKPMWEKIAMSVPSKTGEEKYGWMGTTTKFREWLGDRVVQNLTLHDYTIKNKTFENTVGVKRDEIEDDQYGVYTPLMTQLGMDAALHPDELIFALVQAGFATPCYDGQYFFDTDHPVGPSDAPVSVSNFGGGAGTAWYLLDTSKVVKPFILQKRRDYAFASKTNLNDDNVFFQNEFIWGADGRLNVGYGLWQLAYASKQALDAAGYGAARSAMMSFKSDSGKPLNITPEILLVPPSLEKAALDVVTAERLANGADNVYRNTAKVVTCPWLA